MRGAARRLARGGRAFSAEAAPSPSRCPAPRSSRPAPQAASGQRSPAPSPRSPRPPGGPAAPRPPGAPPSFALPGKTSTRATQAWRTLPPGSGRVPRAPHQPGERGPGPSYSCAHGPAPPALCPHPRRGPALPGDRGVIRVRLQRSPRSSAGEARAAAVGQPGASAPSVARPRPGGVLKAGGPASSVTGRVRFQSASAPTEGRHPSGLLHRGRSVRGGLGGRKVPGGLEESWRGPAPGSEEVDWGAGEHAVRSTWDTAFPGLVQRRRPSPGQRHSLARPRGLRPGSCRGGSGLLPCS